MLSLVEAISLCRLAAYMGDLDPQYRTVPESEIIARVERAVNQRGDMEPMTARQKMDVIAAYRKGSVE